MRDYYLQMCEYGSRFRILKGGKISLVVSAFLAGTTLMHAAPTGGVVTSGNANIAQSGLVTTINQSSQKASINWQGFSIGSNETVNFNQPSINAITLNRVIGNEKSIIDGALNANGQVWLLNSNGVLFNSTARINTSGLFATTKTLSDEDFQNGVYSFKGDSTASVINLGEITINNGGYASLLANTVSNEGVIKAIQGTVTLIGANEATINLNGNSLVNLKVDKGVLDALVENKGAIIADGGKVYLTTNAVGELLKGVVNNTGIIEAQTLDDITGKIELFAHGGTTQVSGTVDATGGFVETSGELLHVSDGTVIKAKEWLLDPANITISAGADSGQTDFTPNSGYWTSVINVDTLTTALNQGTNVLVTTTNSGSAGGSIGDITVATNITWNQGTLILNADHSIYVNAIMTATNNAGLEMNYGTNGTLNMGMNAEKTDFVGKVILANSSTLSINGTSYTIIRDNAALEALSGGDMSGNYVLGNDLDMLNESFTPIGSRANDYDDYSKEFKGNFNGLGNTISNLTISTAYNRDDAYPGATGLFGNVSGGALISNVRLSNASVTNTAISNDSPTEVGALAGYARGQYNNNNVFVAAPTIHNNIVTGSTITSEHGWNVGGIVGGAEDNVVLSNNAITSSTVATAEKGYVGGIAGYVYRNVMIDNAYVADSTIMAGGAEVAGAIVGSLEGQSELKNSYAQANIITAKRDVGGLVGLIDDFGDEYKKPSTITNSFYKLDDTSINGTVGVITYGGIYANQATAWLAGNKADLNAADYLGVANSGFYTIDSTQDLKDMLGLVYNQANKFKLSTNLSLVAGWYLPALKGTFDGNSKTLTGLNVNQDYNANIGFVGRLLGGTVQNLTISGATLNGYANVGGIAGLMRGNTFVLESGSTRWGSFTDGATITNAHVTGFNYNVTKTFDVTWNAMENGVSYDSIGGLVGIAQGRSVISNSDSAGSITMDIKSDGFSDYVGASSIGGLVGSARGDDIAFDHVSSSVGITLKATALVANSDIGFENIGGLVGSMGGDHTNAILSNASATGAISITTQNFSDNGGNDYNIAEVGGLVGYADGLDATTISATNTINIKGDYIEYVGGIVGESYDSNYAGVTRSGAITINPADVTTNQYSQVYSVGGLIGYSEEDTITNATASGTITLRTADAPMHYAEYIGGAIGQTYGTNIDTVTSSVSITATNIEEGESFGGLVGYNSGYNDDVYKNTYQTTFESGDLTTQYNDAKTTYLARADVIALLAQGYVLYDGSYDGSASNNPYYDIYFSMVKYNVELGNIANSSASGNIIAPNASYVGGLVGNNYLDGDSGATITNSHASGEVQGKDNVGGLVGYNYGGNIATSYATGKVTGMGEYIGGLVGYNYGSDDDIATISDSYATGEVVGHGASYVGGLVGENYNDSDTGATISNSYATGAVKADNAEYVGGLIGYNEYALIDTSYATGAVTAANSVNVGGLVGYAYEDNIANSYASGKVTVTNSGDASYVGGLIGYSAYSYVTQSYATGEVSAAGVDYVGGLIGYADNSDIQRTYTSGKVTGKASVGGLVGEVSGSHIEQSYAKGSIVGETNVGGLVGHLGDAPRTILDSYAVGNVTGVENVGGLVGGTTGSSITNTYASGIVTGTTNVGGLVGNNEGDSTSVTASFYNATKNDTLTENGSNVGKTTTELNTLATFQDAGWDIVENTSLTYMYPQFTPINIQARIAQSVWALNPSATIDPTGGSVVVTPPAQNLEPIVSQIINSVTIAPVIPIFTPPVPALALPTPPQQFSFGGQMVQLMSTPRADVPTDIITMAEIRQMQPSGETPSAQGSTGGGIGSTDVRVPLGRNSLIQLLNGGVRLPENVEQEFFMARN